MKQKTLFSKIITWIQTTEMFEKPSKKIPGKWQLFEYYIDSKDELFHFTEDNLIENGQSLNFDFGDKGNFERKSNLPVACIQNIEKGDWSTSKNFITLIDPDNFRNNVEFQFAFEKGNLKLLKRNKLGLIDFFGFFKPLR